jgi:hypothetical protein
VREVGVVAAPLAHAVEPLQDAPRDPSRRVGVLVRPHRAAAVGLQDGEHGLLERLDRLRILRPPAEPRDRLGDPQRMVGADRLAQLGACEQPARRRHRARAQAVDAGGVVVEGQRPELLELLGGDVARHGQQQEAAQLAGAHREVAGGGRGPRLREVDERGDRRGHQQPRALARRLGVGAEGRRRRRRGEQHAVTGRDRHLDRSAVARPRLLELAGAALERRQQDVPQPRGGRRRRRDAAQRRQLFEQVGQDGALGAIRLRYRRGR